MYTSNYTYLFVSDLRRLGANPDVINYAQRYLVHNDRMKNLLDTMHTIKLIVSDHFELSAYGPNDTDGKYYYEMDIKVRDRTVVLPRQITMYFCYRYTKASFGDIGRFVGDKDHATVIHALKVIKNLMDTDKGIKNTILEIEEKIKERGITLPKFARDVSGRC